MSKAQKGLIKFPNGRIFSKETRDKITISNRLSLKKRKRGSENHRWKGGIKRQTNGYILIYDREHPSGQIYILEHRLVMEKHLGRYLLKGENIHHKNGIRGDNRIDNLELWTVCQPSGIRVKDALEWAEEIIKKYSSIKDKI